MEIDTTHLVIFYIIAVPVVTAVGIASCLYFKWCSCAPQATPGGGDNDNNRPHYEPDPGPANPSGFSFVGEGQGPSARLYVASNVSIKKQNHVGF